jgi:outer membrane protein insertion porin family
VSFDMSFQMFRLFPGMPRLIFGASLAAALWAVPAAAQDAPQADAQDGALEVVATTACGTEVAAPPALPPPGSPPFIWILEPCFNAQGGFTTLEAETYLFYIKLRTSQTRQGDFVWYDEAALQTMKEDFQTLWNTDFLEDLSIEVTDHTFPNGTVGKMVVYHMEERERVKIVDYRDADGESISIIKRADIEDRLRQMSLEMRLDTFLDEVTVSRVESVLRLMMADKGFSNATVSHEITPVAGGPKLVNVTFLVGEGPKLRIRNVEFLGNEALSDGDLRGEIKENKPRNPLWGWITGGGTYKETAFEEDAIRVEEKYQNQGYARASVGQPEINVLDDSDDGDTRFIELRVPVTEGPRYRIGELRFEGNRSYTSEGLRTLYDIQEGDWFSREKIRQGNQAAQEVYGSAGHMEFTPFPALEYSDDPGNLGNVLASRVPDALRPPGVARGEAEAVPVVDVTIQIDEGPQYVVNRITFSGNTTTHDNVIRREMRLVEGGVFNSEALKYSVRRLNQLGYFTPIEEQRDLRVEKNPDIENAVDVTVALEEQNRNQLTFGAGISQYEGFFGQLGFQTANFLGRGEQLTFSMQAGDRTQNYQIAFTEPFLFDRNITAGIDVFKRSLQYIGSFTQRSSGMNVVFGVPVADFSRMFLNYSYQTVEVTDLNEAVFDTSCLFRPGGCAVLSPDDLSSLTDAQLEVLARNPYLREALLIGQGGKRTVSKVVPQFQHNSVDHPIFPNTGKRLTASIDLAVLGGNTKFYKPRLEAVAFFRHLPRTSLGLRMLTEFISPLGTASDGGRPELPIFERLYLGGEYSVRGFDIRSIGPTVPGSPVVLGGNKSVVFNAEYSISIVDQVRFVLFYDAGQVRDQGQSFSWTEDVTEIQNPAPPALVDPFGRSVLVDPNAPRPETVVVGETSAFKTSTGVELRFFMPVLNVPFRLIYSWNPQRDGVLDNNFRPAPETTFRFAVGTTF